MTTVSIGVGLRPFTDLPLDSRTVGPFESAENAYDGLLRWDTTIDEFIVRHPTYGWVPLKQHLAGIDQQSIPIRNSFTFTGNDTLMFSPMLDFVTQNNRAHGFFDGEVVTYFGGNIGYGNIALANGNQYKISTGGTMGSSGAGIFSIVDMNMNAIDYAFPYVLWPPNISGTLVSYVDPVNYFMTDYVPTGHNLTTRRQAQDDMTQTGSDDRLKHNEEPLDDALSLVRQLDVQTYDQTETPLDADFNGDLSGMAHMRRHGVIAQELELVAPHLVHERSSDGMKTVDYFSLVGQCLRAIQQLDNRVQQLLALVPPQ